MQLNTFAHMKGSRIHMTELRIALLGSGYMGRTYAECIAKHNSRAKLVAVSGAAAHRGWRIDRHAAHQPHRSGITSGPSGQTGAVRKAPGYVRR